MSVLTSTTFVDVLNVTLNNNLTKAITSTTISSWMRTLTVSCMVLIDITVLLGNLLVICAFFRTRRLQTVTNYFIASLAFADALVAVFVLPLSIYYYQRDHSWKLGLILCDLWVSSDVLLCTSSILNLTCISLDRYMAITRPLTYTAYRSKFLARLMILLVWIVSIVITCPPIFGWRDSNRKYTVEYEHRCELNTARGYVVYSALGSFYIPAVVVVFVYIRIFMVVYDRENLINKFHDNTNSATVKLPSKKIQNGLENTRNSSDGTNEDNNYNNHNHNNKELTNKSQTSFCCCLCPRKSNQQNNPTITHQMSLSPCHNSCLNSERKQNGYLIYRFTHNNNHNNIHSSPHSTPNTPPSASKAARTATIFCRPCTLSTRKMAHFPEETYHYRRTYLSRIGAEYQFRTGDSPCYELKTFQNSLPTLVNSRSHSFERSPSSRRRDFNTELNRNEQLKKSIIHGSTNFNEKQQSGVDDMSSSNQENTKSPTEELDDITQSLDELTRDLALMKSHEHIKSYRRNHPKILSKCSSLNEQSLMNSSTDSNVLEQKSLPERTRINRRTKPSRLSKLPPSAILLENLKQQHKIPPNKSNNNTNNCSSIKSNQSLASLHRLNENDTNKSKHPCCFCYACVRPLNYFCEMKTKKPNNRTPNQSLTYDDDEDEILYSNDTNNRGPLTMTSNTSLRGIDNSHTSTLLSSSNLHQCVTANKSNPTSDVHRRERIRFMKEQKTAKTLAVVVGGFILFWLPFFTMYVIPPDTYSFNAQTATLITWLGYFNSVINPFIYAYCSKQFRMAFWNITFGMCYKKSNTLLPVSVKNKQSYRHHING